MAIVTLEEVKEHLNISINEIGSDDNMLSRKITAAQAFLERRLGYRIEEEYGGADQESVPEPLREGVLMLVAWWYENREAAGDAVREVPFGVADIVTDYRNWSF